MSPGSKRKKTGVTKVDFVNHTPTKNSNAPKLEANSCNTLGSSSRKKRKKRRHAALALLQQTDKVHDVSKSVTAKLPQQSHRAGGSGNKKNDCTYNNQPKVSFSLEKKPSLVKTTNVLDCIPLHKGREGKASHSANRNTSVQKSKFHEVVHESRKKRNNSSCNPLKRITCVKTLASDLSETQNTLTLVSASQIGKNAKKSSEHPNSSNRFCDSRPQRIGKKEKKDSLRFNKPQRKSECNSKNSRVNHKQNPNEKVKNSSSTDKDVSGIGIKCHKIDSTSPILTVDDKRNSLQNVDFCTAYAKGVPLPSKKTSAQTECSASTAHPREGLHVEQSDEPCYKHSPLHPAVCEDKVNLKSTLGGRTSKNHPSTSAVAPGFKCKFSNEELIKRYDRAHPPKGPKESKSFHVGRKKKQNLQCHSSVNRTETLNYLNPLPSHAASVKVCDPYGPEAGNPSSLPIAGSDHIEEIGMEWEAIENEEVLLNIKEHRQQCQNAGNIYNQPMEMMETNCLDLSEDNSKDILIVLDTNILISHLKFVKELSEQKYKGMGRPLLVIPWMVLRELDALKDGRDGTKFRGSKVSHKARLASHFINKCFNSQHPQVKGQSALDDKDHLIVVDVPDDNILNCCLQLQRKGQRVVLLSNDVNFCNKAMATGISSFGKEKMLKILNLDGQQLDDMLMNSSTGMSINERGHLEQTAHSSAISCKVPPVLTVLANFESLLQDFLTKVIEAEMRRIYDEMWIQVVFLKPPWTVVDALICLSKHWIAVFSCIMSKPAQNMIENLLMFFKKKESCEDSTIDDLEKVILTALNLCDTIHLECYQSLSSEYKIHLQLFLKIVKESKVNYSMGTFQDCMEPKVIPLAPGNPEGRSGSSSVLEVFQHIWDLMNEFCGITCDILGIGHSILYRRPQSFPSIAEVKGRLPEALNCISLLVNCLSSILETAGQCLSVKHAAIVSLLSVIQAMVSPEFLVNKDISLEMILEFCVHDSCRLLLSNGLRQFQETQMLLLKVSESLNLSS